MRVPGRTASWTLVVTLLLLATGFGLASVATSPSGQSARKASPPTSLPPPPLGNTTLPPTTSTTVAAPSEGIVKVAFFNATNGYGLFAEKQGGQCSLSMAHTLDGGATYSGRVALPTSASCSPSPSIAFGAASDGFVFGPGLFVSHDGGTTWADAHPDGVVLSVVPLGRSVWMLQTLCPSTESRTSCPLVLQESTDGGRSWPTRMELSIQTTVGNVPAPALAWTWLVRTSPMSALILVPVPLPLRLGETGGRGVLLSTSDGGAHWQQQVDPCPIPAPSVSLLSEALDGTLWSACATQPAAGSQLKAVAHSTDGGKTWVTEAHCDPGASASPLAGPNCTPGDPNGGYLEALAGVSTTTALIDGERNDVSVSHDGGATWQAVSPLPVTDANGSTGELFFTDALHGWEIGPASGMSGAALWRTTDGGSSWHQVWPPSTEQVCQVPQLALTAGSFGEASGEFIQTLTFTNVSSVTCQLGGWPGFQVADAAGHLVPTQTQRVRQGLSPPLWTRVVLIPRQTASFDIFGADFDSVHQHVCPMTSGASITPPDTTATLSVPIHIPDCGRFQVAPVISGSSDRDSWSSVVG
jgi:photosystem II stability/assembly factor-like uncharacterized protein